MKRLRVRDMTLEDLEGNVLSNEVIQLHHGETDSQPTDDNGETTQIEQEGMDSSEYLSFS